ncbi:MAG: caspase family protein [Gammaproteobacteria bacterium]
MLSCASTSRTHTAPGDRSARSIATSKFKVAAIHPASSPYTLNGINRFFSELGLRVIELKETYQMDYGYFLTVICSNVGNSFDGSIGMYAETVECTVTDRHSRKVIYHGIGKYSYLVKSVQNYFQATLAALEDFSLEQADAAVTDVTPVQPVPMPSVHAPSTAPVAPAVPVAFKTEPKEKTVPVVAETEVEPEQAPDQAVIAANEKRTALLIGNSDYQYITSLDNPKNDAADLAKKLEALGFSSTLLIDATQEQMENAVRTFGRQLTIDGGIGLFYYAGHGIQMGGQNYLIPANAHVVSQKDVKYKGVHLGMIMEEMGEARNGLNIIILDACRDNPLPASGRGLTRGLAQVNGPRGSFIAFATAPGETAQDGDGRNGTYTKHLLEQIGAKGLSLEKVFKNVAKGVVDETNNIQVPWVNSSFIGEFYFSQ